MSIRAFDAVARLSTDVNRRSLFRSLLASARLRPGYCLSCSIFISRSIISALFYPQPYANNWRVPGKTNSPVTRFLPDEEHRQRYRREYAALSILLSSSGRRFLGNAIFHARDFYPARFYERQLKHRGGHQDATAFQE
jgi:hypothetical protein